MFPDSNMPTRRRSLPSPRAAKQLANELSSSSSSLDDVEEIEAEDHVHDNDKDDVGDDEDQVTAGKMVRFQDMDGMDLAECLSQSTLYYPTPPAAKQVIPNKSLRRFAIDEVELYFSEDTPDRPVAPTDYAVTKIQGRDGYLAAGTVQVKRRRMGISVWKSYWAELFHGLLILRRHRETDLPPERKRTLIPVAGGCHIEFLDVENAVIQLEYTYQGHGAKRVLRFSTKEDMFTWWYMLHLSSVSHVDNKLLHKSVGRPSASPRQLREEARQLGSVLFPPELRPPRQRQLIKMSGKPAVSHLILVRHGETENINFRVSDRDKKLTTKGRRQAELTAQALAEQLQKAEATEANVSLVYSGLRRTVETAAVLVNEMPWISRKHECCLLEDGAPKEVDSFHRPEYRSAMHKIANEVLCRWDDADELKPGSGQQLENYKIVVCHTSFIQYCMAQCLKVTKDVIQLGAPISHCSITQIDVSKEDAMEMVCMNRVAHLPLTYRTNE